MDIYMYMRIPISSRKGALSHEGGCSLVAHDGSSDDIGEKAAEVEHVEGTLFKSVRSFTFHE
jgi:hypothetical protein